MSGYAGFGVKRPHYGPESYFWRPKDDLRLYCRIISTGWEMMIEFKQVK